MHTDMGSAPSGSRAWATLRGSATVITADARDAMKTACRASAIPPEDDLCWVRRQRGAAEFGVTSGNLRITECMVRELAIESDNMVAALYPTESNGTSSRVGQGYRPRLG